MKRSVITHSFEETQKLGIEFARELKGGEVIALHGDLGSGKTTFVQGLAVGLGIEKRIISPTFIIMRSYVIPDLPRPAEAFGEVGIRNPAIDSRIRGNDRVGIKNFYHVDLYRVEGEADVDSLGLRELMGDPESIVVIEWPEKIARLLPKKRLDLYFEYVDNNERKIVIGE